MDQNKNKTPKCLFVKTEQKIFWVLWEELCGCEMNQSLLFQPSIWMHGDNFLKVEYFSYQNVYGTVANCKERQLTWNGYCLKV